MSISEDMLIQGKKVAEVEAELRVLTNKRNELAANGDPAALRDLNVSIGECESRLLHAHCEYQDILQRTMWLIQHKLDCNEGFSIQKLLDLHKRYLTIVNWLCEQRFADENGEETTCWDVFLRDHPEFETWNYIDFLHCIV